MRHWQDKLSRHILHLPGHGASEIKKIQKAVRTDAFEFGVTPSRSAPMSIIEPCLCCAIPMYNHLQPIWEAQTQKGVLSYSYYPVSHQGSAAPILKIKWHSHLKNKYPKSVFREFRQLQVRLGPSFLFHAPKKAIETPKRPPP